MKRFLVGTAGHIDHGKTALVKALTGIDADRLPEEKRRGITIDLGFAHAEWNGVRVSFVDVPGHERFVRNMLAGAGGIQAVLLVVAADESVMPQTREHFEIVRLLGLSAGVIAVTKVRSRCAGARRGHDRRTCASSTRGSFLENAPIVPVSSRTGEGLEALKAALVGLAASAAAGRRARPKRRAAADRSRLSRRGIRARRHGEPRVRAHRARTTGWSCFPNGRPVRVRRLEVHGREVEEARAGERVSANLAGAELSDLRRGLVLATPSAFAVSRRLVARGSSSCRALPRIRSGDRLTFHHFASEATAGVRVLDGARDPAGRLGRVELRFGRPIAAVARATGSSCGGSRRSRRSAEVSSSTRDRRRHSAGATNEPAAGCSTGWRSGTARRPPRPLDRGGAGARASEEEELARRAGACRLETCAPRSRSRSPSATDSRAATLARSLPRRVGAGPAGRARVRRAREARGGGSGAVGVSRADAPQADPPSRRRRAGPRRSRRRSPPAACSSSSATRRGLPGRSDLEGSDRELSERIADFFRRRGLDPPSPAETAEAVRHHPKVVEGLIGYLVKTGALVRLPGGWIVARETVDAVVERVRATRQGIRWTSRSSRRCSA